MLYRFQIELSDIDRGVYESLDFRVAQHPSETAPYLLSRVIAYCLNYQTGLEFTPGGLNDPDSPALRLQGLNGALEMVIEIGNPSARRLHKASKAARQVVVFTYKNAEALLNEINTNDVHKAEAISIYPLDASMLQTLEGQLQKNNRWALMVQDQRLSIEVGTHSFEMEIKILKPSYKG